MKELFASKKAMVSMVSMLTTLLSSLILKDNPELAEKIATLIVGMCSVYVGGQSVADAFGGNAYHKKK